MSSILSWFTGGPERHYMTLDHCMVRDWLWIGITVGLDLSIAAGYLVIAFHWWKNQKGLDRNQPAYRALGRLRNIFLFCGLCGYLFIPIKMVWPAWRLYDLFMLVLAYSTWRYAWNSKDLKVVYQELDRSHQLSLDLERSREESRRKSLFLNAISHDLRTPLNGVSLQAEYALLVLESEDLDAEALRESVKEIRSQALSVGRLLDEFLELGRLDWASEEIHPTHFVLGELLDEVVSRIRLLPEAQRLNVRAEGGTDLVLLTDRTKLERILQNLVHNAVKFTSEGHVVVRARNRLEMLAIEVEDSGMGIARNQQEDLFEEFYQVHNRERDRSKGFGLGLAIARRLARQLGGDLQVESELGRGSRFDLLLPARIIERDTPSPLANGDEVIVGSVAHPDC